MNTFTLKETIDKKRINSLINCGLIGANEKKTLQKYLKLIDKDNRVSVSYAKNYDKGRRYALGGLSLQMFSKKTRHTLFHDTHIDIDIVNCHLVLISQYCKKNHISFPIIDDNNSKRSSRIQELITKCNITRKVAKEFILTMMYLGQSGDYCANHGFSGIPPAWCDGLKKEFVAITDLIVGKNSDIYKTVSMSRKKEYGNKTASTVSFVLQIIEDNTIMNARHKLSEMGFEVETLCFDGLMCLKQDINKEQLEELNAFCFDRTGYNVEFEIKPMNDFIKIKEKEPEEITIKETGYYDQLYFSRLKS